MLASILVYVIFACILSQYIIYHLSLRELHLLPILDSQLKTKSVDFIVELPEFIEFNTVMIVVDSISKRMHSIPTHITVTAESTDRSQAEKRLY